MLNRRLLRIKVLQVLYSAEQDAQLTAAKCQSKLKSLINAYYRAYLLSLLFIDKVGNYAEFEINRQENKLLKDKADKPISLRLVNNPFIKALNDEDFTDLIAKEKLEYLINKDDIQKIFKKLLTKERYQAYTDSKEVTFEQERKITIYLFNKVIIKNALYSSCMEDEFINWYDDRETLFKNVNEKLRKIGTIKDCTFNNLYTSLNESGLNFAQSLLIKTINEKDTYLEYIKPHLKNWDADRVTTIDMLLLNMAVVEFIQFENVPIKVTINEYIEISKQYSTPNSKDFINGILDKLMIKLKEEGKINKSGRGLVEF